MKIILKELDTCHIIEGGVTASTDLKHLTAQNVFEPF